MADGIGGSSIERELEAIRPWAHPASPISSAERAARLEKAREHLARMKADALLVTAGASLRYFTGITWGQSERLVAMLLPKHGHPVIICPAFETGSLSAVLDIQADVHTWEEDEDPYALTADIFAKSGGKLLALDPWLPLFMRTGLRSAAPTLAMCDGAAIIDACRTIKSEAELALMKQAKAMTLEVHRRAARILRPGITTTAVKRFIDDAHRAIGSDAGNSFCIVQFGEATSYPHGVPYEQKLKEGDLVLIDTGCQVQGYNSDITRTYVFGEPTEELRKVWNLEAEAQRRAFEAVRPGVTCGAIDEVARKFLESSGFGPGYRLPGLPHRTGHGIGLSVHEAPYLVRGSAVELQPGMCFSNEPMIVIPGKFGIRLEDHFYVTQDGAAWFTQPSPSIDRPFGS